MTSADPVAEFADEMRARGIIPPERPIADSKLRWERAVLSARAAAGIGGAA